jgi:dipeptide transport system ATP-binding protein
MDLLLALQKEQNMGLVLITHDLAVVAETAQRVCVMYAGQAVEVGQVPQLFDIPRTLQRSAAQGDSRAQPGRRAPVDPAGHRAGRYDRPQGCLLSPRCPYVQDNCRAQRPPLTRKPTASPAASTR